MSIRLLTCLFSSLPAFLFGACALTLLRDEYYWTSYVIIALIYISASLLLGRSLPAWLHGGKFDYPWLWLFTAGGLAWLIALLSLALLNFSPLCVGQDNGDGSNNYSLCVLYTVLLTFVCSPIELVLITLSAFIGGKVLSARIKVVNNQALENLVR